MVAVEDRILAHCSERTKYRIITLAVGCFKAWQY